jgi:hypothetical protein
MSSKKMPTNSSLIALPPAGAVIGFWALIPSVAAIKKAAKVTSLFI